MVECITLVHQRFDPNIKPKFARKMVGPFGSFDEAQEWMELQRKLYQTMLIHTLADPYSTEPTTDS